MSTRDRKLKIRWPRWLLIVTVLATFVVVCRVSYTVYLVNSTERDYVSTIFAIRLVEDYVTEHGMWPKSWKDLEHVKRGEPWNWPKNAQDLQQSVVIDFDLDISEIASMTVEQFQIIRPTHSNELFNDKILRRSPVESLLKKVRQLVGQKEELDKSASNKPPIPK